MALLMMFVLTTAEAFYCMEWMRGDGNCDRVCMVPSSVFPDNPEITDCASLCESHCAAAQPGEVICRENCNTWDCGWASCNECVPGCDVSMLGNEWCDRECDVEKCGFDSGDCEREMKKYVAIVGEEGDGSLRNPFVDLGRTLNNLWYPNNTVFLLNGIHLLNRLNSIRFPLLSQNGLSTTLIQPLMCSNTTSDDSRCVNYRATIRITHYFAFFNLNHSVTFSNVDFRGDFDIKEGCFTPECIYCPYLSYDSRNSSWITDQNKIIDISQAAEQTLCDIYHDKSFIVISKSGKLTLNNVSFVYFRQQLRSLIEIDCGDLEMESVDFVNNMAAPTGLWGGLIQLRSPPEAYPYYCGSITFSKGTVSLLNNGYEYRSDIVSSGFLSLDGVYLLNISYVDFSFNFIAIGDNVTLMSSALISLNKFRQVSISDCTFEYNFAGLSSMLYVDSYLTLPLTNVNGIAGEHALVHMSISNCKFIKSASLKGATIQVNFHENHQNIRLSNLVFIENYALLGAIFLKNESLEDSASFGHHYLLDGQDVFIPPPTVSIRYVEIRDSVGEAAFVCSNIENLELLSLKLVRNGESSTGLTSFNFVLKEFMHNIESYINYLPSLYVDIVCNGIASVSNTLNLTIKDSVFSENYCPNGVPGLILSGETKDILIVSNNFTHNVGSGLMTLTVKRPIEISGLYCISNTHLLSKASVCFDIRMEVPSDVLISDSQFLYNLGQFSTVMFVGNTNSLTLQRVSFIGNLAKFTTGGVWFNPKASGPSAFTIIDSVFHHNYASKNGVITISDFDEVLSDNDIAIVTFSVISCSFVNNTSSFQGASITINDYIKLARDSLVSRCSFLNNTSVAGSSGYFTFQHGILTIDNCLFEGNIGADGSALYLNHFPTYTLRNRSVVNITNCLFRYQSQGAAISIVGHEIGNEVAASNNIFLSNYAGAYSVCLANVIDHNSEYRLQTAKEGPVFFIQRTCSVACYNLTATENRSTLLHGGVFYLTTHSKFGVFGGRIHNNSAKDSGGVAWVDENSVFEIADSLISGNTAGGMGSVFYIFPGTLTVRNCNIHNNFAQVYASVSIVRSVGTISNTTFSNNTSLIDSPGIVLSGSTLNLTDSVFSDQTGLTGAFLFSIDHSTSDISRSHFVRGHASFQGGAIHLAMDSTARVTSSLFEDCASDVDGGMMFSTGSELTLIDTTLTNISSRNLGGGVYAADGELFINTTQFSAYSSNAVYTSNMKSVEVQNSEFHTGVSDRGAAINCFQSALSVFANNSFVNNTSKRGGAMYLQSSGRSGQTMNVTLSRNLFTNNAAIDGGAVYLESVNARISESTFESNSAVAAANSGSGGAVFLSCELTDTCDIEVVLNRFVGNNAKVSGGGIAWQGALPAIEANLYVNNSAVYGSDICSYAIVLGPVAIDNSLLPYLDNTTEIPLSKVMLGVASGQPVPEFIRLALFDHLSQRVTNDFQSTAELYAMDDANVSISGNVKATAEGGVFTFQDFSIIAVPGTVQYLIAETHAVDVAKKEKANDQQRYYPQVRIEMRLRKCVIGESQLDNTCFVCSPGTYSLDPTLPCKLCPDAAICYGNYTMVPKEGFWRVNNETDQFIKCLADEACAGSPDQTFLSLTGLCSNGYSGNLCQICLTGFSRTGRYQCAKCPGLTPNIAITTLIVIVMLSFVALIVFTAIRGASRPRSLIAIYIKIFMNYLQMIVVSSALNLNWPSFVKTFLNGQEAAGGVAEQLFSFECLFQDVSVGQGSMYFTKVIGISFLPVVLFIIGVIAWMSILCCFKLTDFWLKLKSSLVVILFILHPTITKTMFSYFACMDLGLGEMWLINDLSIKCWDSAHLKQIVTVILPSICVWIIGFPGISLLYLIANRKILESWHIKQVFSFLYKGYESPYFYWEFVILYRKVALVSASVFLNTVNIRVQALTILALLLMSLFLQIQIKPFNEMSLNRLEVRSILVSAITIYAGLYYETNNISSFLNILIFVGMLLANAYFLTYWLRAVSPLLILAIRERLKSLWRRKNRPYRVHPNLVTGSDNHISIDKGNQSSISHSDIFSHQSQEEANDPPNSVAQSPTNPQPLRELTEMAESREVHYTFEE